MTINKNDASSTLSVSSTATDEDLNLTPKGTGNVKITANGLKFPDNSVQTTAAGAGVLGIAGGGTNSTATPTAGGAIYGTGTAYAITAAGTSGQVLTSNGSSAPTWSTPGGGSAATPTDLGTVYGKTGSTSSASATSLGFNAGLNLGFLSNSNTFIGYESGFTNQNGSNNVALGRGAFRNTGISTGDNVAIGFEALNIVDGGAISSISPNTAVGTRAMSNLVAASNTGCTAVGFQALRNGGDSNTAVGFKALNVTTGGNNSALGSGALLVNTTGDSNSAFGKNALLSATSADQNSAFGRDALPVATGGTNSAFGAYAGERLTSGTGNTTIGYNAGYNITTGVNNTVIGNSATASSATVSNEITLGNSSIGALRCAVTTITAISDARDKKDITPLQAGIEFIKKLNPVNFIWNMRDGGKVDIADAGFIAQDLKQVQIDTGITIPNLVYENNPDKLEASYGTLIPVLVKAIQEQQAQIESLTARITTLEGK